MYCAQPDEVASPRIKTRRMNAINYGAMGMARTRVIELKIANALERGRGREIIVEETRLTCELRHSLYGNKIISDITNLFDVI